jgi:hypothetical protein
MAESCRVAGAGAERLGRGMPPPSKTHRLVETPSGQGGVVVRTSVLATHEAEHPLEQALERTGSPIRLPVAMSLIATPTNRGSLLPRLCDADPDYQGSPCRQYSSKMQQQGHSSAFRRVALRFFCVLNALWRQARSWFGTKRRIQLSSCLGASVLDISATHQGGAVGKF